MMSPPLAALEVMHARAVLSIAEHRHRSTDARAQLAALLTRDERGGHVERDARTLLDRIARADAATDALLAVLA